MSSHQPNVHHLLFERGLAWRGSRTWNACQRTFSCWFALAFLVLVHEAVGAFQQRFDLLFLGVVAGDDSYAQRQGIAAGWGIPRPFMQAFFDSLRDLSLISFGDKDGELVAAQTSNNVGLSKAFAQQAGGIAQGAIAFQMAKA